MWAVQISDIDLQFEERTSQNWAKTKIELKIIVLYSAISRAYQIINPKKTPTFNEISNIIIDSFIKEEIASARTSAGHNWILLESLIKLHNTHNSSLFNRLIPHFLGIMSSYHPTNPKSNGRDEFNRRLLELLEIN